jgi:ATP-dependent RNA helicase SUPV3L1/SUV3
MLEHETGMIGLPLRLLAREVYDRVSERLGESAVALVTGEERRVPARPHYWVCTVEAMPTQRSVDFVAVDEIQLAGHPERGHVFTDRLLAMRGVRETWFMGAASMRPLISQLLPEASFQRFARLSKLVGVGSFSTGNLPPRSAVVAFSRTSVYTLAERMRARRGGAAVVMGSLSPRARNAQVAMYQAGEVDYLVATDAIGMGLNLDVDRIAFAELNKFDGRRTRALEISELSQIAGRAGRYQNDGAFGTLAPEPALSEQVSRRLERHQLPVQKQLSWRNSELCFDSVEALLGCLLERPRAAHFRALDHADDVSALRSLAKREKIVKRATSAPHIALLWEVCQIPDYRQLLVDHHANLLEEIYLQLVDEQRLKDDWLSPRIARQDRVDGDVETLTARIAFIRTWTYVAHRGGWLRNPEHWQAQTRAIEDRLSDALHEALVARFVERKKSYDAATSTPPQAADSHPFSPLRELKSKLFGSPDAGNAEASWGHALADAEHHEFTVDARGRVSYSGMVAARLIAGRTLTEPAIVLVRDDLGAGEKARVMRRLRAFARDYVTQTLGPLAEDTSRLSQNARGLVYQLTQWLGTISVAQAAEQVQRLVVEDRAELAERGILLGKLYVFCVATLGSTTLKQRTVLARAFHGAKLPALSEDRVAHPASPEVNPSWYLCQGYAVVAELAIRIDRLERLLESNTTDWQSLARALRLDRGTAERVSRALGAKRRKRRRRRRAHKPSE